MTKWCEIFRAGTYKKNDGTDVTYSEDDIKKIADNFNFAQNPSAPIVIGHPKTNSPAYGWVDKLKAEGGKLYACYKQVAQEFAQWVNDGRFKNRSISLYPDLRLKHVGWLGAVPPRVKGMPEYVFNENEESLTFEFSEIEQYNFETGKEEDLTLPENNKVPENYSEELEKKSAELEKLQAENEALKAKNRKADYEQFAEQLTCEGNITPAQRDFVIEFQEICHQSGTFDFAEGEDKSVLNRFRGFLKGIKQVDFSELPNGDPKETLDFANTKAAADKIRIYQDDMAKKGITVTAIEAKNALKGANNE